jgi:hypothetical protein
MNGGFLVALTIRSRSREWLIRVGLTSSTDRGPMAVIASANLAFRAAGANYREGVDAGHSFGILETALLSHIPRAPSYREAGHETPRVDPL